MNKTIKTILYILIFGAFSVSLAISYLYIKDHQAKPIPAEVKENMPEIINYNVNILSVEDNKLQAENMENQEKLDIILSDETQYSKITFGSDQTQVAVKSDITQNMQADITVLKEKDSGELKARFVQILIPY